MKYFFQLWFIIVLFFIGCSDSDKKSTMTKSKLSFKDSKTHPLTFSSNGIHSFGGKADHQGSLPKGTTVPLHIIIDLNLNDPKCPLKIEGLNRLPLYYPLKYDTGGAAIQYKVLSDDEIEIIFMSNEQPDGDDAYVQVESFPELKMSFESSIESDENLDWFTITIGGKATLDHKPDNCLNKNCGSYKKNSEMLLLASVPPLEIPNHKGVWYEFEGAYMLFYFWYCNGCDTIYSSNRST